MAHRDSVWGSGDNGATAGKADTAANVGVADIDKVFGFGSKEGFKAVAASTAPDLAKVVVVAGSSCSHTTQIYRKWSA